MSIVLLVVLMVIPLSKTIMLAHFYINQDFIAANFCQDRALSENKCKGQCVLSEQLKETEQAGEELPGIIREMHGLEWLYKTCSYELPLGASAVQLLTTVYFLKDYTSVIFDFFHPPCVR